MVENLSIINKCSPNRIGLLKSDGTRINLISRGFHRNAPSIRAPSVDKLPLLLVENRSRLANWDLLARWNWRTVGRILLALMKCLLSLKNVFILRFNSRGRIDNAFSWRSNAWRQLACIGISWKRKPWFLLIYQFWNSSRWLGWISTHW